MIEKFVSSIANLQSKWYLALSNFVLDLPILAQSSISIFLKNVKILMVFLHFYVVQKWNSGSNFLTLSQLSRVVLISQCYNILAR